MEPCGPKNENEIINRDNEKNYPRAQSWVWVFVCVRENKRFNTFKVTIIIFLGIRNVNLLFKKDFKSVKLLNKK